MKNLLKIKHLAALLLMCAVGFHAGAQEDRVTPPDPDPNPGSRQYNVVINSDFESKCLLPNEGPYYYDELPHVLVACQGQEVTYTAYASTDGDNVVSWSWLVTGAASVSYNDNVATVLWGTEESGMLSVTITMASGYTCTHHQAVRIVEKPVAVASSVPDYDASHTIYVCYGMDVEFTDQSHTQSSDIAGYLWEGCGSTSSTRSFLLQNVTTPCKVTHRVYNNCGCYDEEEFLIKVLQGHPLQLDCYGTACEGSTVSYHATSPSCTQYFWSIEGGHLVNGQGTPNITVTWDSPLDGYGIISLDGPICGNGACQGGLSVRVPIIQNGVSVDGQNTACVGEAVVYSVPLYGSTHYDWNITPSTGVSVTPLNGANIVTCLFNTPDTFRISVKYKCDFLSCGEFRSDTLTVVVKPRLEILGDKEVCLTNTITLTTNDENNNLFTWNVYDLANNQLIYTSPSPTDQLASSVIPNAGRYRITAENSNYCNEATFVLTVKDPPPAPTVAEMDPDNPTIACPNSTIRLNATPSNPYYNFIWEPTCGSASPTSVSGEEVSITYGSEVCNVNVYHYDRELQCRSLDAYTHQVAQFALAETHLPKRITVCPGTRITWGNDIVPAQEMVLYEWQIEDLFQRYITVDGSIHSGPNTFTVSDIYTTFDSVPFQLYLSRRYCGDEKIDTVQIIIYPMKHPSLSFDPQDAICQNSQVQLYGSGCTTCDDANAIGRYTWSFSDSPQTETGQTIYHTFDKPGDILVTLTCNPYDVCNNSNYLPSVTGIIKVIPNPPAYSIGYDGTNVFLEPQLSSTDYAIRWGHTSDTNNTVPASLGGGVDYSCIIISRTNPPCTTEVKNEAILCQPLQLGPPSIDYCNKTVSFSVLTPPMPIVWSVLSGDVGDQIINGSLNEYLTLPVNSVGNIVVKARAEADEPCFSSTKMFTVDFLPDFSLQKACSSIVIQNNSQCHDVSKVIMIKVTEAGGNINYLTFPVNQSVITYPTGSGGHFTFELYAYDGMPLVPPCPIGSVDIANTSNLPLDVTSANTGHIHQTCNNTAIQLTASLPSPHTIVHSRWDFGDGGTCLDTNGNSVYHTFRFDPIRSSDYIVNVFVTDENGCESHDTLKIISFENVLKQESISIDDNGDFPVCPGNEVRLEYQINSNTPPTGLVADYNWSSSPNTNTYTHNAYYTDDYSVVVTNDNYCKTEATINVPFKNKPSAIIIPKKYYYCAGEEVILYGQLDNDNHYTYAWTVYEDVTHTTNAYTTGTVHFTAANNSCTYTINLTVTNDEGCSAQADPVTITVVAPPPAPSISIDPTQHCIDQHPFKLISNNPSQLLHWSNGDYGNTAYYHYPGPAIAYYYDPVSGCRSDSAVINIPAAPDFDALLTGCYKVCDSLAETSLPVYGLLPLLQPYGWDWYYNNYLSQNGPFGYQPYPLMLPLNGFGSYYLSVNYFEECKSISKPFVLQEDDVCKCDSIDIRYVCKDSHVKECHLIYEIEVTVCNNSHTTRTFNTLTPLFNLISGNITITNNTFAATSITPSNCYNFTLELEVSILDPMVASFMIKGSKCNVDFSIDLTPDINCSQLASGSITPNSTITGVNTIYCDFSINISGVTDVLAVWSDPQSVVNYTLTGTGVNGLCAFSQGDLSDGVTACVYALVCVDKKLCIYYYCVPVADLLASPKSSPIERAGRDADNAPDPTLKPNPTTGEVSVVGTSDKILEILVMDMNGRTVATFTGSDHFNISNLPSGIYIVRIKTQHDNADKITYLKLVKK